MSLQNVFSLTNSNIAQADQAFLQGLANLGQKTGVSGDGVTGGSFSLKKLFSNKSVSDSADYFPVYYIKENASDDTFSKLRGKCYIPFSLKGNSSSFIDYYTLSRLPELYNDKTHVLEISDYRTYFNLEGDDAALSNSEISHIENIIIEHQSQDSWKYAIVCNSSQDNNYILIEEVNPNSTSKKLQYAYRINEDNSIIVLRKDDTYCYKHSAVENLYNNINTMMEGYINNPYKDIDGEDTFERIDNLISIICAKIEDGLIETKQNYFEDDVNKIFIEIRNIYNNDYFNSDEAIEQQLILSLCKTLSTTTAVNDDSIPYFSIIIPKNYTFSYLLNDNSTYKQPYCSVDNIYIYYLNISGEELTNNSFCNKVNDINESDALKTNYIYVWTYNENNKSDRISFYSFNSYYDNLSIGKCFSFINVSLKYTLPYISDDKWYINGLNTSISTISDTTQYPSVICVENNSADPPIIITPKDDFQSDLSNYTTNLITLTTLTDSEIGKSSSDIYLNTRNDSLKVKVPLLTDNYKNALVIARTLIEDTAASSVLSEMYGENSYLTSFWGLSSDGKTMEQISSPMLSSNAIENLMKHYINNLAYNVNNLALKYKSLSVDEYVTIGDIETQIKNTGESSKRMRTKIYHQDVQDSTVNSNSLRLEIKDVNENGDSYNWINPKDVSVYNETSRNNSERENFDYDFAQSVPEINLENQIISNVNTLNRVNIISLSSLDASKGISYYAYIGTSFYNKDKSIVTIGTDTTVLNMGDGLTNSTYRSRFKSHNELDLNFKNVQLNNSVKATDSGAYINNIFPKNSNNGQIGTSDNKYKTTYTFNNWSDSTYINNVYSNNDNINLNDNVNIIDSQILSKGNSSIGALNNRFNITYSNTTYVNNITNDKNINIVIDNNSSLNINRDNKTSLYIDDKIRLNKDIITTNNSSISINKSENSVLKIGNTRPINYISANTSKFTYVEVSYVTGEGVSYIKPKLYLDKSLNLKETSSINFSNNTIITTYNKSNNESGIQLSNDNKSTVVKADLFEGEITKIKNIEQVRIRVNSENPVTYFSTPIDYSDNNINKTIDIFIDKPLTYIGSYIDAICHDSLHPKLTLNLQNRVSYEYNDEWCNSLDTTDEEQRYLYEQYKSGLIVGGTGYKYVTSIDKEGKEKKYTVTLGQTKEGSIINAHLDNDETEYSKVSNTSYTTYALISENSLGSGSKKLNDSSFIIHSFGGYKEDHFGLPTLVPLADVSRLFYKLIYVFDDDTESESTGEKYEWDSFDDLKWVEANDDYDDTIFYHYYETADKSYYTNILYTSDENNSEGTYPYYEHNNGEIVKYTYPLQNNSIPEVSNLHRWYTLTVDNTVKHYYNQYKQIKKYKYISVKGDPSIKTGALDIVGNLYSLRDSGVKSNTSVTSLTIRLTYDRNQNILKSSNSNYEPQIIKISNLQKNNKFGINPLVVTPSPSYIELNKDLLIKYAFFDGDAYPYLNKLFIKTSNKSIYTTYNNNNFVFYENGEPINKSEIKENDITYYYVPVGGIISRYFGAASNVTAYNDLFGESGLFTHYLQKQYNEDIEFYCYESDSDNDYSKTYGQTNHWVSISLDTIEYYNKILFGEIPIYNEEKNKIKTISLENSNLYNIYGISASTITGIKVYTQETPTVSPSSTPPIYLLVLKCNGSGQGFKFEGLYDNTLITYSTDSLNSYSINEYIQNSNLYLTPNMNYIKAACLQYYGDADSEGKYPIYNITQSDIFNNYNNPNTIFYLDETQGYIWGNTGQEGVNYVNYNVVAYGINEFENQVKWNKINLYDNISGENNYNYDNTNNSGNIITTQIIPVGTMYEVYRVESGDKNLDASNFSSIINSISNNLLKQMCLDNSAGKTIMFYRCCDISTGCNMFMLNLHAFAKQIGLYKLATNNDYFGGTYIEENIQYYPCSSTDGIFNYNCYNGSYLDRISSGYITHLLNSTKSTEYDYNYAHTSLYGDSHLYGVNNLNNFGMWLGKPLMESNIKYFETHRVPYYYNHGIYNNPINVTLKFGENNGYETVKVFMDEF